MKYSIILTLLLLKFTAGFSWQIGVGVVTDKISFWRYWEKSDSGYKHKMIVFNTADRITELKLEQVEIKPPFSKGEDKRKNIFNGKINMGEYEILDMPHDIDEYIEFHINGEYIGVIGVSSSVPPEGLNQRFVSDELYGGRGNYKAWIGKNNLFTKNNQSDTISLYVYYDEEAIRYSDDGFFKLILRPFKDFQTVEVKLNNKNVGVFDAFGKYEFEMFL